MPMEVISSRSSSKSSGDIARNVVRNTSSVGAPKTVAAVRSAAV